MIYTCTYNPAIDYLMEVEGIVLGGLNRSRHHKLVAGGKGINIAIVLANLGIESVMTGFVGGFTGKYLVQYIDGYYQLKSSFVMIEDSTRVNIKLNHHGSETEINALGPVIKVGEMNRLLAFVERLGHDDILAISGSPAQGVADNYLDLIKTCGRRGIEFVLDTYNNALKEGLPYRPLLVKPNLNELQELFEVRIDTLADIVKYGKKLLELGAKNVIVSMGAKGNIFLNDKTFLVASPIKGIVKNTVGAGDSMVAGFLAGHVRKFDFKESFRLAVACGTATAFSDSLATKSEIDSCLTMVEIEEHDQDAH